ATLERHRLPLLEGDLLVSQLDLQLTALAVKRGLARRRRNDHAPNLLDRRRIALPPVAAPHTKLAHLSLRRHSALYSRPGRKPAETPFGAMPTTRSASLTSRASGVEPLAIRPRMLLLIASRSSPTGRFVFCIAARACLVTAASSSTCEKSRLSIAIAAWRNASGPACFAACSEV